MNRKRLLTTSVAKKVLSAITGLLLCLFLVAHLAGNLSLMAGNGAAFNTYARFLNESLKFNNFPLVLLFELSLAALILLHAYTGVRVWMENKKARPQGYANPSWARNAKNTLDGEVHSRKSWGSTTMALTGTIILVFIVLHVLHFKFQNRTPFPPLKQPTAAVQHDSTSNDKTSLHLENPADQHDLAQLVITEFQKPIVVILYLGCLFLLGLHLNHGFASAFQSIGVSKFGKSMITVGRIFTIVIIGGFMFIPIWAMFLRSPDVDKPTLSTQTSVAIENR